MDGCVNAAAISFGMILAGLLGIVIRDLVYDKDGSLTINYPLILEKILDLFIEKTNAVVKFKNGNTFVAFKKLQSKNVERSEQYAIDFYRDLSASMQLPEIKQACIGNYMPFMFTLSKIFNRMIGVKCSAFNRLVLPTAEKPSKEYLEKIFSLLKKANGYAPTRSGIIRKLDIPLIKENGKWIVYFTSAQPLQIFTVMEIKVLKNTSVPIYHVPLDGVTVLVINDPEKFRYTVCECCMTMKVRVTDLVRGVTGSVKHCRTICMECAMMNPLPSRECECHGSQICSGNWRINYDGAPALETTGIHTPESVDRKTQNTTRRRERVSPTGLQRFAICCPNCGTLTHHSGGCNSLDCGGIARGRDCSNPMCITCGSNVIPCGCGLTSAYREPNQNPAEFRINYRMYPIPGIAETEITELTPVAHITRSFPIAGMLLGEVFAGNILTLRDMISIARGIFAGKDIYGVTVQQAVRDLETVDDMVVLAVASVFALRSQFTLDKHRLLTSGISTDLIKSQVTEVWWEENRHLFRSPAQAAAAAPAPRD